MSCLSYAQAILFLFCTKFIYTICKIGNYLQIVGEIRAARNALVQVTAKLRDYLYRDNSVPRDALPPSISAPVHDVTGTGRDSNSPVKVSTSEAYQGGDPQAEVYQSMHATIGTWLPKVNLFQI